MNINRPDFRVIAQGDDAVGFDLTLVEAIALLEHSRQCGKRHLAIVNDTTGSFVDEDEARRRIERD